MQCTDLVSDFSTRDQLPAASAATGAPGHADAPPAAPASMPATSASQWAAMAHARPVATPTNAKPHNVVPVRSLKT